MLIELSGQEVLSGFCALGVVLIIGIWFYRAYNQKKYSRSSNNKDSNVIVLATRTKHPNKNVLQHRPRILGLGLTFSLLFTLFAMSWTVYEREVQILCDFGIEPDEIEVMPRTRQEPPPPLPPPPKMTEVIVDDIIEDDEELPDISVDIDEPVFFDVPESPKEAITPSPPPLPIIDDAPSDIPFRIVEKNPMFDGCKDQACSDNAFLSYIYKHISYPAIARENGIEGRVTAQFVIERDGHISAIKILRGIGAGCDKEVLNVLNKMNQGGPTWKPGEQRGKPVRVIYTLPVTYSLKLI